jgi:hypothetical protein
MDVWHVSFVRSHVYALILEESALNSLYKYLSVSLKLPFEFLYFQLLSRSSNAGEWSFVECKDPAFQEESHV